VQAQHIVRLVRDVFGRDVLGAYLHGSAVLGGLRPTGDLDILVVIARPTTATERRALVEGLLDVSGARARGGPARPVELSVVVEGDIKPWRYPPRQEFLYGEWLRDADEQAGAPPPEPAPEALAQLPPEHQPPLARARDMYLQGEDETRWADLPAVRAHAEYVVKTIRALV
jgi:predicted nucleotidyltransferase